MLIAQGHQPDDVHELNSIMTPQCFSRDWARCILGCGGLFRARYCDSGRQLAGITLFGDRKLSDLRTHIAVPVLEVKNLL